MFGLFLAFLYSGWAYFSGVPFATYYDNATNFLFWWWLAIGAIIGVIYLVVSVVVFFGATGLGISNGGLLGGLLGIAGGGVIAALMWLMWAFNFGCLLIGAVLLRGAYAASEWDGVKLAFGIGFVLVGLIVGSVKSSSSSSSSSSRRSSSSSFNSSTRPRVSFDKKPEISVARTFENHPNVATARTVTPPNTPTRAAIIENVPRKLEHVRIVCRSCGNPRWEDQICDSCGAP